MSCSPFDLKDYFLQELADPQRRQVEAHVKSCQPCREELDRLRLTEAALFALRDEEIPQRIAFVSDPVFEPSPWRRALSAFWNSGARLGFASAAMLSAALVVFALQRPAPAPVVNVAPASAQTVAAAGPAMTEVEVQARIDAAVAKAVAPLEARQKMQMEQVKADLDGARQRLILAEQEFDYNNKRQATNLITAGVMKPVGVGELK
jgi:anti-sigma factor RsiW